MRHILVKALARAKNEERETDIADLSALLLEEAQILVDELITALSVDVAPVTREIAMIGVEALRRYGKGYHPAGLNFGDLLSYATAKATGLPLLFKGNDFSLTDISPAYSPG